ARFRAEKQTGDARLHGLDIEAEGLDIRARPDEADSSQLSRLGRRRAPCLDFGTLRILEIATGGGDDEQGDGRCRPAPAKGLCHEAFPWRDVRRPVAAKAGPPKCSTRRRGSPRSCSVKCGAGTPWREIVIMQSPRGPRAACDARAPSR